MRYSFTLFLYTPLFFIFLPTFLYYFLFPGISSYFISSFFHHSFPSSNANAVMSVMRYWPLIRFEGRSRKITYRKQQPQESAFQRISYSMGIE
jgi:hypothetical protein